MSDEEKRALANFDQDALDAEVSRPPGQNREFGWVNLAIHLAHEWQVYSRQELDIWRRIGVVVAAGNLETVDAVLVIKERPSDLSTAQDETAQEYRGHV